MTVVVSQPSFPTVVRLEASGRTDKLAGFSFHFRVADQEKEPAKGRRWAMMQIRLGWARWRSASHNSVRRRPSKPFAR